MKKIVNFFAVILLSFSVFACKNNDKSKNNQNDDDTILEEPPVEEPEEEPEDVLPPAPVIDYCGSDYNACFSNEYTPNELYNSLEEAYQETYKSVVTILTYVDGDLVMNTGSGFIYAESVDGYYVYILTNAHVIKDNITVGGTIKAKYYEVLYHNNVRVKAHLLAKDLSEDIAVLKADIEPNNDFKVAKLGDNDNLKVGESVYAIGSPYVYDYNNTLTSGIISGLNVNVEADNDGDGVDTSFYLLQVDAALSSGNSGGPLFNLRGEVVGINTLKIDGKNSNLVVESLNFCLKINHVKIVANQILKDGVYNRPYIGILARSISNIGFVEREELGISENILTGVFVEGVFADTPAAYVIPEYVVILEINGVKVNSLSSFSAELFKYLKGDVIALTYVDLNGQNRTTKNVTLA